jgi:indolepyruvate ferredoxin oxidoreductase
MAGIGCHFMALWMDRNTATFTHMGGEGAPWTGQAHFTECPHVFANIGDGTYFHSGLLAIRAAVAAGVSMTYKILYNDAVAMTGGQHIDGPLDPARVSRQIAAEGVKPIVAVVDEKEPLPAGLDWAPGVTIRPREELDAVQRELREVKGVSAIIYVQTCATEKRRRRKREEFPDPPKRVVINELVCEGCGDCNTKSNCLSVEPLETEFGRKRAINQSACNKDFSCLEGFCPSFVTVEGGSLRKGKAASPGDSDFASLPEPHALAPDRAYEMLVTGIGGMGVITIGQIVAMAAHLEGKGATVLDMSGLAQKFGPVMSHVKIARSPGEIHSVRVGTGAADLVLGCDLVVASGSEALSKMNDERTKVLVNATVSPTADFVKNPDWQLPGTDLRADIVEAAGAKNVVFVPAGKLATALMGDAIATNMFMLGYAFQKGWVPLAEASLVRAIELNGVAVKFNEKAFLWGRRAAADIAGVERIATPAEVIPISQAFSRNLDELIARRVEFLTAYQNAAYAARYTTLVERVRAAESKLGAGTALTEAVARYSFKLMAYKDEYEVARLHSDPAFMRRIEGMFEGDYRLKFHLAPPIFNRPDPITGEAKKSEFGSWMGVAFRILAKLKFLRGTALDIFGYSQERRTERHLIAEYEATVAELLERLGRENHALAVEIASVPEHIRGYGQVKRRHLDGTKKREAALLAQFRENRPAAKAA